MHRAIVGSEKRLIDHSVLDKNNEIFKPAANDERKGEHLSGRRFVPQRDYEVPHATAGSRCCENNGFVRLGGDGRRVVRAGLE